MTYVHLQLVCMTFVLHVNLRLGAVDFVNDLRVDEVRTIFLEQGFSFDAVLQTRTFMRGVFLFRSRTDN